MPVCDDMREIGNVVEASGVPALVRLTQLPADLTELALQALRGVTAMDQDASQSFEILARVADVRRGPVPGSDELRDSALHRRRPHHMPAVGVIATGTGPPLTSSVR